MPAYQTLLFDLDGTLTDPKPGITRSVQYALARFHINVPDLETLIPFIGPPLAESFHAYYGFNAAQAQQAIHYYREYFSHTGIYENSVYPGIPALLSRLQIRRKHLVIATSKPTIFAERVLAHFHLDRYFELVVGSNLDGSCTNKAEVIASALAKLPLEFAQTAVMIGDRKHDILGAQQNGIHSIAVAYGYGEFEELQNNHPTRLVYTVADLTSFLFDELSVH